MEPLMDWVLSLRGLTCVGITPVTLEVDGSIMTVTVSTFHDLDLYLDPNIT